MVVGIFWVVVEGSGFILVSGGRWCVYFDQWWVVVGLFCIVVVLVMGSLWVMVGIFYVVVSRGGGYFLGGGGWW